MIRRDPYQVLGVPRDADADAIKRAYRRLARQYHPDQNPESSDASERFQEAAQAYTLLSDPVARREYDRHGGPVDDAAAAQTEFGGSIRDLVGGVLDGIFGSGPDKARGRDLRYTLDLTLGEASLGCEKTITFESLSMCDACEGDGGKKGVPRSSSMCRTCEGLGQVKVGPPILGSTRTCPVCSGRGRTVSDPCESCGGEGVAERKRSFSVKVPAASVDGAIRILKEQGEAGRNGGLAGDLHILLKVEPHPLLRKEDSDLWLELPVSLAQAALGATVTMPTLEGTVELKIPPATPHGKIFVLEGRGVPKKNAVRGDMMVRVLLELPIELSTKQRKLLEELQSSMRDQQGPKVVEFKRKLKEQGS